MSLFTKLFIKKSLQYFFKFPHIKSFYKSSILGFDEVRNLFENVIENKSSCKLFGSTFYGLEKVNYYTVDEVFLGDFYQFKSKNENPVIIDCGANIGLSVLYFKKTHPNALVYSFEPDTRNFDYLSKNVTSYGWEKSVHIYKQLVSDSAGFEYFEELGNAGSKIVSEDQQNSQTVKIEKIRLKDFVSNLNTRIDFLKLDIEGSEFQVLPDMKELFPKIDKMYIEFHCEENDFVKMYEYIKLHIGEEFRFQISTNFTEDQNIYHSLEKIKSKTYYNCFAVNKNNSVLENE